MKPRTRTTGWAVVAATLWATAGLAAVAAADVDEVTVYFGAMSPTYVRYSIPKKYDHYFNPPGPGDPGYNAWPIKTRIYARAVEYMVLKEPDFTSWQKEDVTRDHEWGYPGLASQRISAPTAKYNCHSYALAGTTDYWVQGTGHWTYLDPWGDYEEWYWQEPFSNVDISTYGLIPGYWDVAHSAIYNPQGGSTPCLSKHGAAGVYQTDEYVLELIYGWEKAYYLEK